QRRQRLRRGAERIAEGAGLQGQIAVPLLIAGAAESVDDGRQWYLAFAEGPGVQPVWRAGRGPRGTGKLLGVDGNDPVTEGLDLFHVIKPQPHRVRHVP